MVGYNPHGGGSLILSLSLSLSLSYFRATQTKRLSIDRGREARRQTRSRIITLPCANAAQDFRTTPK